MALWYWLGGNSTDYGNVSLWNSLANGTGSNPGSAPWVTTSGSNITVAVTTDSLVCDSGFAETFGNLTKSGNGTLTLGNLTYSGNTTISAGAVVLTGNLSTTNILLSNGSLALNKANPTSLNLWGSTSLYVQGNSTIDNLNTDDPLPFAAVYLQGNLTFTGSHDMTLAGNPPEVILSGNRTITVSAGNLTLLQGISDANGTAGSLTKAGNGTLILVSAGQLTYGVTISAGTLQLQDSNAIAGNGTGGILSFANGSTGTLQLYGGNLSLQSLSSIGSGTIENGGTGNVTLTVNTSANSTFTGTLRDGGNSTLTLVKTGNATLNLNGNITYTGNTTVSAGALFVNGNQVTGNGTGNGTSSAVIHEAFAGRTVGLGANSRYEKNFVVVRATSETDAVNAVLAAYATPPSEPYAPINFTLQFFGLTVSFVRDTCTAKPHPVMNGTGDLPGTYDVTLTYVPLGYARPPYQPGDMAEHFELGPQAINLKQADVIDKVDSNGNGTSFKGPDYKGAINVTDNGIEGVNVEQLTYSFSLTLYWPDSVVNDPLGTFKSNLRALAFSPVNNANWTVGNQAYAAGSLRFLGCTGSKRGRLGDWEINYRFAERMNSENITVGGLTIPKLDGWDYIWFKYQKELQTNGSIKWWADVPKQAYIQRVYQRSNFAAKLGFGADS